eukprot:5724053-Amphidinium_carterae.1
MMNIREFRHWMSKPKNGALEAAAADMEWHRRCEKANAIIDYDGPDEGLRKRVWVHKATNLKFRDQERRTR